MSENGIVSKKLGYIRFTKKQDEIRFAYALAKVQVMFIKGLSKIQSQKLYRFLLRIRRKLKIAGRVQDLVPLELKFQFPNIPDWAFEKYTRNDKIKILEDYANNITLPEQ